MPDALLRLAALAGARFRVGLLFELEMKSADAGVVHIEMQRAHVGSLAMVSSDASACARLRQ